MDIKNSIIYILGTRTMHNELLGYVLEKEVCPQVTIVEEVRVIPAEGLLPKEGQVVILAINFREWDFEKVLLELNGGNHRPRMGFVPVLFELESRGTLEQEAIRKGIRGFFYRQDSLSLFLKGFRALFRGEIWVSREALVRSVLENTTEPSGSIRLQKAKLTSREVEILLMVSSGANNTEIADKLCISPHTVKTHLYNIFQKISVPNRLQAALWAARNL
jgi:LuxR family transcriptional regulator of csgAB operon